VVKGDIAFHIPSNVSFEEAATLGSGLVTVAFGLYKYLGLPFPTPNTLHSGNEVKEAILIYGGSSATGTLAIQLAKLSGLTVITTCSARNFDLVKNLGADSVLDYHDPDCGSAIRKITNDKLTKVFDTIATPETAKICADALGSAPGGLYVNLMGVDAPREDVKSTFFLGYTVTGESFWYEDEEWPAVPEDFELGVRFYTLAEELLAQGRIKAHKPSVREGGLDGILSGMQELKEGKVSGEKLVYLL